jgi:hypothetical protein
VPVVRHREPSPIAERLLLLVDLPFLVGYLGGTRLASTRRMASPSAG